MPEIDAILVFRNGQIGNTLMAVPALRALRRHFPKARIDVVVDALAGETLRDCPYIDDLIHYERHDRHHFLRRHVSLLRRLRSQHYDLALLFKRFFRNELLACLAGARKRIGFQSPGHRPYGLHLTIPYEPDLPVRELNLRLVDVLGVPRTGDELEFWVPPAAITRLDILRREQGWDPERPWVVIHGMGRTVAGLGLGLEHYLTLARALHEGRGLASIWLFGPDEEAAAQRVRSEVGECGLVLQGEELAVAGAALSGATLFVGQDSGPSHLAEAVGCPSVVVYDDSRPGWEANLRRWRSPSPRARALLAGSLDAGRFLVEVVDHLSTQSRTTVGRES